MNRYTPLVSAIAVALLPVALHATTVSPDSLASGSVQQTRSDAMAEMLARMGLYRFSTRYQTVVQPSAPIYVTAPAPAYVAPSAPPPPAADCDSSAPPAAPAVEQPVAPVVFVAPPVAPAAPPAAASFPVEPEAPAMRSSQARLQDFFVQFLGARSRLSILNVTAAPVVITTPAVVVPAPVVVAQAAPKPACKPKDDSSPPADGPGSTGAEQLADLGIESFRQGGGSGDQGEDTDEFFVDAIDPPRSDSDEQMEFGFNGPALFSVQEELLLDPEFEPEAVVGRVPEPGSLALLGLGLIGLGLSRRRATTR